MNNAQFEIACRRLRWLRRNPPQPYAAARSVDDAMSFAYETALRVLIDEAGAGDRFHALFYGPQAEQSATFTRSDRPD